MNRFIVRTLGYWGRGETIQDAAMKCWQSGAKPKDGCIINLITGDTDPTVNSHGDIIRSTSSENITIGRVPLKHALKFMP